METLRAAFEEIRAHGLRSSLTLSGIVLGCMALVVMSSVMDGVGTSVREGFADLGFDGVFGLEQRSPQTPQERLIFQRSRGLTLDDIAALRARGTELAGVTGRAQTSAVVRANDVARLVHVIGVEPDYAWIRNRRPAEGRFISEGDVLIGGRACVIGSKLRTEIFGSENPIGREISIDDMRFTIVGIGRKLGNSWFREGQFEREMEGVIIPLTTFLREFPQLGQEFAIEIKAANADDASGARAEVMRIMTSEHRGATDFKLENMAGEMLQAREQAGSQLRSWRIVMLSVAAVTLIVGGVGLLSVLLISLAERTYEIGLRKALGATAGSIFALFLAESMILSLIGAGLGMGLGVIVTHIAARGFKDGLPLSVGGMQVALIAALTVGFVFGVGPALRASRMEPVEALREQG